jgi:hypothetical protein
MDMDIYIPLDIYSSRVEDEKEKEKKVRKG